MAVTNGSLMLITWDTQNAAIKVFFKYSAAAILFLLKNQTTALLFHMSLPKCILVKCGRHSILCLVVCYLLRPVNTTAIVTHLLYDYILLSSYIITFCRSAHWSWYISATFNEFSGVRHLKKNFRMLFSNLMAYQWGHFLTWCEIFVCEVFLQKHVTVTECEI